MDPKPMKTPDLSGLLKARPRQLRRTSVAAPADVPATPPEPISADPVSEVPHHVRAVDSTAVTEMPAKEQAGGARSLAEAQPEPPGRRYTRSISIYLPRSLHAALGKHAEASGQTRTAIILRAVSLHHQELSGWIVRDDEDLAEGGLFEVPQRGRAVEPVVQTALRVTDEQLAAMDELARQLNVRRSHIMVAALRAEQHRWTA